MKKSLLLALFIVFFTDQSHGQQVHIFRKVSAGIYAGPQLFGKIYTSDKLSEVSGITAGIDVRFAFSKEPEGFSLHFQPGYNTFRHFTSEGKNTRFFRETTWRWKAFHFPLLVRYTFSSGKVRPFAEIGPTVRLRKALTVRHKGTICGIVGCSGGDVTTDLQSETTKDPIALTASAGVEIDVWKVTIPISLRIQEGLSTYEMKEYIADGAYYEGLKTRTIQVTAGVTF